MLAARVPALLARARALLGLPGGPPHELGEREIAPAARAVLSLHEGLVGARALARPDTYEECEHLGAYLLWWWPMKLSTRWKTSGRVKAAFRLLPAGSLPEGDVLDLGAGPAPATLAAIDSDETITSAVALDASGAALDEALALAQGAPLSVRHWKLGPGPLPLQGARFELIVAAHLLSELPGDRVALVQQIAAGHACFQHYRQYLKRTIEEQYALFLPG